MSEQIPLSQFILPQKNPGRQSKEVWEHFTKGELKSRGQANDILQKTIKNNRIIGGGLKSYCKTRWTSMYDLTESVLRLKPCFDIVSYYINICLI
jgi:hypothetical protein